MAPPVENATDHAARFKEEIRRGEFFGQPLPQALDVFERRGFAAREAAAELDANRGGMRSIVSRINCRPA